MYGIDGFVKGKIILLYLGTFIEKLIAHYGDINNNTLFSQLVNLQQ